MSAATTRPTRREPVAGHVRPGDFRHRAACRSVDPEIFFPAAVQGREYEQQVSVAKTVCAGCPVRAECLSWALAHQPDGIAGGMTEHERRIELARRRVERRGGRLPKPRVPSRPVRGTRAEIAAAGRGRDRGRSHGAGGGGGVPGQPDHGRPLGPRRPQHRQDVREWCGGCGGGERRVQPGSPPDLPQQDPGRDTSGRKPILDERHHHPRAR